MQQWIGVDIGTQGTKAVLFNDEMQPMASAFEASRLINPTPGVVWQEPREMLQSVLNTIGKVMSTPGADARSVGGIGIDSQMAGIMGIDEDGEAATVYDSWLDNRCSPYIEQMRAMDGREVTAITGGPVSCSHGPKILWLKNEHPELYAKVAKFVLPHGYVIGKLAGLPARAATFDHTCLQYSGFGDNLNKCWSPKLLDRFGVDGEKMPRIVSPFEVVGGVTPEAAAACGLRPGTPLVAGAGDTAASIFGTGMFETGTVLDCAGTASVLCGVVKEYAPDVRFSTLTMMRSPEERVWYPLAYIGGGGMCIRWMRDTLGAGADYAQLEQEAARIQPGCEGLVFVPHWSGRVLPNDPSMKGAFLGLDWKHSRGHMYRAVMEAIAFEYAYYMDVMKQQYPLQLFSDLYAVGGGAASELFLRIKSHATGLPVTAFEQGDAALVGSAVIAAHGTGALENYRGVITRTRKPRFHAEPDPQVEAIYQDQKEAYLDALKHISSFCGSAPYRKIRAERTDRG